MSLTQNAIIDAIRSRFSLLLSANLFVYLFITIVFYAICNSSFPSKVNKFIINYRLLYKFMFEYDKNKHDDDSRELNELFEKLLSKIQELFEKNHGNPIMNEGWCNLNKNNIIRSRRSRTELNYCEEDELDEDELDDDELDDDELDEEDYELDEEELDEDDYELDEVFCETCSLDVEEFYARICGKSYCKNCFIEIRKNISEDELTKYYESDFVGHDGYYNIETNAYHIGSWIKGNLKLRMSDMRNSDHYSDRTDGELDINEILGTINAEAPTMEEATVTEDKEVNSKESTEDEDETYIKV